MCDKFLKFFCKIRVTTTMDSNSTVTLSVLYGTYMQLSFVLHGKPTEYCKIKHKE